MCGIFKKLFRVTIGVTVPDAVGPISTIIHKNIHGDAFHRKHDNHFVDGSGQFNDLLLIEERKFLERNKI